MSRAGHPDPGDAGPRCYHRRMSPSPAPPLVLASLSPRRRRLLSWLDVPFAVTSVDTPEDLSSPLARHPERLAEHLAAEKARAAAQDPSHASSLVLCFDTIVVLDSEVLGKPKDVEDAWRMLRALRGRTHQVVTGCAMACPGEAEPRTFSVTTDVTMRDLTDAEIEDWMASGEFMGCAGAYNIEGQVAEVTDDECYLNVTGSPLCHVYAALSGAPGECVAHQPSKPIARCDAELGRRCRLGPALLGG